MAIIQRIMRTFTASRPLDRINHSLFCLSRLDPFPLILCSRTDARHRSSWRPATDMRFFLRLSSCCPRLHLSRTRTTVTTVTTPVRALIGCSSLNELSRSFRSGVNDAVALHVLKSNRGENNQPRGCSHLVPSAVPEMRNCRRNFPQVPFTQSRLSGVQQRICIVYSIRTWSRSLAL